MLEISAVIMASGFSRRMGRNKLLLPYRGKTLLGHTLVLLERLPLCRRILVCTSETHEALLKAGELATGLFTVVHNMMPDKGQSVSMRLGLEAANGQGVIFFTGDQPLLDAQAVLPILEAATEENIVVPLAGGKPCSPVYFGGFYRSELTACEGDQGGRHVRDAHPESCLCLPCFPDWKFTDIDTPEQYAALLAQK